MLKKCFELAVIKIRKLFFKFLLSYSSSAEIASYQNFFMILSWAMSDNWWSGAALCVNNCFSSSSDVGRFGVGFCDFGYGVINLLTHESPH